jgi:hypothetical protein
VERIYSDTSVLLSYIQHWVEQNDAVPEIIESSEWDIHSGLTVGEELFSRRDVRTNLYTLLLSRSRGGFPTEEESSPIESMDAEQLPYICPPPTSNDISHLEELIEKFQNLSPGDFVTLNGDEIEYQGSDDNPFFLREYKAEARSRTRTIKDLLSICQEEYDEELKGEINNKIDNSQDSKVLAEAVEWRYVYSENQPNKVVTLDRRDMFEKETEINKAIADVRSEHARLDITMPSGLDG